jgi:type IV pilus assembly protein PilV
MPPIRIIATHPIDNAMMRFNIFLLLGSCCGLRLHTAPSARRLRAGSPRAGGYILYEVLVAMIIFIIGLLGLLGMQARLTAEQTNAKFRADAADLAADVIGRMWSDLPNLAAYNGCTATLCTEWQTKVSNSLPSGLGTVKVTGSDVDIEVTWTGQGGASHIYKTATTILPGAT